MKHTFKVGDKVHYTGDVHGKKHDEEGTILRLYGITDGRLPSYDVSWDSGINNICHPENELIDDFCVSQFYGFLDKIEDRLGCQNSN